jgi:hypothetical protein
MLMPFSKEMFQIFINGSFIKESNYFPTLFDTWIGDPEYGLLLVVLSAPKLRLIRNWRVWMSGFVEASSCYRFNLADESCYSQLCRHRGNLMLMIVPAI